MGIDFTVFKGSETGEIVEAQGHRDLKATEVGVQITHCGVCGTDEHYRHARCGLGHEGVGTIIELGSAVESISDFRLGHRVGMGWLQKACNNCESCLLGDQRRCTSGAYYGNVNTDQGCFGSAVAWDVSTLFKVPEQLSSEDAAPLMCGGATVWSPLYDGGWRPGQRVGVVGIGGLGHLAIQFASKMGAEVVAFSSSESKRQVAMDLGATEFHTLETLKDSSKIDILIVTSSFNPDISQYMPALNMRAKIYPLTISTEPLQVSPLSLISTGASVVGSGVAPVASHKVMLEFAAKHNIKPYIEKFLLTQAGVTEAMQKLRDGKMRYRGVLVAA